MKEQLLPTEEEQSAYAAGNRDPEDTKWHYYLEEAEQEPEVQAQLDEIRKEYATLTPDQLKVIDPCSGSGHILAYMFDVLMKIYESYGYTTREAVASIVENNIYGLDIDDRAAQLAYFAVMMKARQYDRRFFSRGIQPHVYAIVESDHVDKFAVDYFCNGDAKLIAAMDTIISELHDAKEYGSILTVTPQDWSALYERFAEITEDINMSRETALRELLPLVQVAEALAQKYDTVVTNPPYAGVSNLSVKVNDFVKKNYPDSKADLFAVFIERCNKMTMHNGFQAMITQHAWMFLSSFEKMRKNMMLTDTINMTHLGARAFEEIGGEVVQTTSFVRRQGHNKFYKATYCRLVEPNSQQGKEDMFCAKENRYYTEQENFAKIPGNPVAYWTSNAVFSLFESCSSLENYGTLKVGISTADNNRFVRLWHEIDVEKLQFPTTAMIIDTSKKWFPFNNGGQTRRWYGNNYEVVNWENSGAEIVATGRASIRNRQFYLKSGATWTDISTGKIGVRFFDYGYLFSTVGLCLFSEKYCKYLAALLNSLISVEILKILCPTLHFNIGDIAKMPVILKNEEIVNKYVDDCKQMAKIDWDSFEISWDFQHHPLLRKVSTIAEAFTQWQAECDERFNQLKANEEELNRIFIDIYGLQDELTPEVEDKDVTVRKADLGIDIRSFISYAVGCMFGRYSLDVDGLAYAGGEWDKVNSSEGGREGTLGCASKYASFAADKDNIIPICDDEYFEDDIVGLFVEFVKTVYGEDTLDENLRFIADALGGKGQPKDVIRNYFLNDFYKDHCKTYQKRPIYWLFDSGKKNGFKALIYMHRYQPDTIARIRTDYVHEQQARYRTAIADLEQRIANVSTGERVKLKKKLTTLQAQDTEIRTYEEKIHHLADQMISIDLDDGVKKNYAIFQDVLAKIKDSVK